MTSLTLGAKNTTPPKIKQRLHDIHAICLGFANRELTKKEVKRAREKALTACPTEKFKIKKKHALYWIQHEEMVAIPKAERSEANVYCLHMVEKTTDPVKKGESICYGFGTKEHETWYAMMCHLLYDASGFIPLDRKA